MSFFKDFKDDLTQAVNELLPDDHAKDDEVQEPMVNTLDLNEKAEDEETDSEKMKEWLEEFAMDDKAPESDTSNEEQLMNLIGNLDDMESEKRIEEEGDDMDENIDLELLDALNSEEEETKSEEAKESLPKLKASGIANDDEVTVISKGTTINGSISSEGSLDVMGNVTGDIDCLGKLSITGRINGNSSAAEVYVNTERMEGSITSEGSVKVGLGTVVIGDITATSGVIAGAVKGEIDINGPIVIDSTAIIKGNIKTKSVQINNGAVIEGFCSLSYSEVDVDNIFE